MPDENVTTPDGTEENPYLVHTWAELVDFSTSGAYVKVANDIDVLAEYPDGDAPTLTLGAYIDGDNHTISRWYCTGQRYMITTNNTGDKYIENAIFTNIKTSYSLVYNQTSARYGEHTAIRNCKFAGIMGDGYVFDGSGSNNNAMINGVVVNIKGNDLHLLKDYTTQNHSNCNIKLVTNAHWIYYIYANDRDQKWYDSYFDITAPNLTSIKGGDGRVSFDNCVLDIKTVCEDFTFDTRNSTISIFNSTNAPGANGTAGKIVGVDDTHWLDAAWIADNVGFNIVEEE